MVHHAADYSDQGSQGHSAYLRDVPRERRADLHHKERLRRHGIMSMETYEKMQEWGHIYHELARAEEDIEAVHTHDAREVLARTRLKYAL